MGGGTFERNLHIKELEGVVDVKLLSVQIALFSSDLIGRPDLLMNEVNSRLGSIFNAMPNILNLPPEIPAEIPLVQARSTDDIFALNVSRSRIDFIVSPEFSREDLPFDIFKEYKPLIEKYCKATVNAINLVRVGVIMTLFQPTDENVKRIHEKYFCGPFPQNRVEIKFNVNEQNLVKGMVYNNIKTVEAIDLYIGEAVQKGVIFQLDTNNIPDDEKAINYDVISSVLTQASSKIKTMALKELI